MSEMHHDTSSDLKVVADKLRDILQVFLVFFLVWVIFLANYFFSLGCSLYFCLSRLTIGLKTCNASLCIIVL